MSKTDREWQKWGVSDPYYGVLGYPTEKVTGEREWHSKFMATGRVDLTRALTDVERLFGLIERGRALDFGCGVGRIMAAMLEAGFEHVDGIDVSPEMIAEAHKNIGRDDAVAFYSSPEEVPQTTRYDFVHSYIVLQHIRPSQGIPIIKSLLGLVKPGGSFSLHFPIAETRRRAKVINFLRYRFRPLHLVYNAVRRRRLDEPVMEMNRYQLWRVLEETVAQTDGLYGLRWIDTGNGPLAVVLMGRVPE